MSDRVTRLYDILQRCRLELSLPPLVEFDVQQFPELLAELGHCDTSDLQRKAMQLLDQKQHAAWQRVHAVLRCRVKLQFILFGLPSSEDLIEDVVQQSLLKSHRSFATFSGSTERKYFAWLFAILDNAMKDFAKGHRRHNRIGADRPVLSVDSQCMNWSTSSGINVVDSKQETPSAAGQRNEAVELLYAKIPELGQLKQEIVLRKMADETFEAIANRLKSSKPTVCRHYHAALRELSTKLEGL